MRNFTDLLSFSWMSFFILDIWDVIDSTSEVALSREPLQVSSWKTHENQFRQLCPHKKKKFVNRITEVQKLFMLSCFKELTSSCSLLQLFSCSFKSCRSLTACRLAMPIFLSVSLLLFLCVSSKCFLSAMVAFLSLMFWLAWTSFWMDEWMNKTNACSHSVWLFRSLYTSVWVWHNRLYQRTLLHLSVSVLHLLDRVFPLMDELLCLHVGLLQIFCSFIQSNLLRKQKKNIITVTVCGLKVSYRSDLQHTRVATVKMCSGASLQFIQIMLFKWECLQCFLTVPAQIKFRSVLCRVLCAFHWPPVFSSL